MIRASCSPNLIFRAVAFALLLGMVLLTVGGCAAKLSAPVTKRPLEVCRLSDDACLAKGRQAFEAYRQMKVAEIEQKSNGYRLPSAPVALLHPHRTEYSVLLVHGLNDSAYYMADIAAVLHARGFNTVTVLLPGHGTDAEDMLDVTAQQWRSEVEAGIRMASLVGRKMTLGGFSLGAALAIDATLRRDGIHGLFLFAPALELRAQPAGSLAGFSCLPGLRTTMVRTKLVYNPVKYKYRSGNGVCQLHRVMRDNATEGNRGYPSYISPLEKVRHLGAQVSVPTFLAMTYADARISPSSIIAFAGAIKAPVLLATFGTPDEASSPDLSNGGTVVTLAGEALPHSYLVRRTNEYNGQVNLYFDELETILADFVDRNYQVLARGTP